MDNKFNKAAICTAANRLIKKGRSRSEAFHMAWMKTRKVKLFPFQYKCGMCGGYHTATLKSAVFVGIANVGLIALLVLKLTGRL